MNYNRYNCIHTLLIVTLYKPKLCAPTIIDLKSKDVAQKVYKDKYQTTKVRCKIPVTAKRKTKELSNIS